MLHISAISENALVCQLPAPAELEKQRKLWAFADALKTLPQSGEIVVGMNNITIFTKDWINPDSLISQLHDLWQATEATHFQGKHIDIPVIYGGEDGMDLLEVAEYHHISPEEVIRRHTEPVYTVFMIGFQAGFPYLGGLPEHLHTPRRSVPRTHIKAGSVGIGGSQTGIYPFASPAGWQILGRTHTPLFDANASSPTLLSAGDTVRFIAAEVIL